MKKISVLIVTFLSLLLFPKLSWADITSSGSGDWSSSSTWVGGVVPGSAQNVFIAAGHVVNIDNGNATCNSISFGDTSSHLTMGSASSVLSIYGDFTIFSTTHQVFLFNTWPTGAKIKFTGSAATQTLSGWSTSASSTIFMEIIVDKSAGKVVTSGTNMRFSWGTSFEINNGTFELASTDDLESRNLSGTGIAGTITVGTNGVFTMVGGGSHIRRGINLTDTVTSRIGKMTVYGIVKLTSTSSNRVNIGGIDIMSGGMDTLDTGWSTGIFNCGKITIYNGGTLYNSGTTNLWHTTSLVELQSGGEFNAASSTTPIPPYFVNNGTMRFSRSTVAQTLPPVVTTYNNLILSGGLTKTLGSSITVNGTLEFLGTASLALGGFSLNYGPSAELQYGASGQISAQTTSDAEWPVSGGPQKIQIYNSSGVTLHNNRTIAGTLTLTLGTFDNNGSANDKTLTLSDGTTIKRARGVLTTAPSFAGTVNLEYTSTIASDTTSFEMPASTSALNNLMISSTQGVTLGSNVTVNGILTLTGSKLTTSSSNLLTLGPSASVSGGSATSFVNGPLARTVATTSPVVLDYPVGKGTAYRSLQLSVTQTASTSTVYTAEQFEGASTSRTLPGSLNSVSSVRYFNITKGAGSGVTNASVRLSYDTDDLVSDASILRIGKDNGSGAWVDLGGSGTAPTTGTITSSVNFTTFSDFVLARTNSSCVLSLTAVLEAMWVAGGETAMTMTPSVTVELHDASTYALIEAKTGTLSTAGAGSFTFTSAANGTPYFIVVKSANTIEVWSATAHTFTAGALTYDFTTGTAQAYTDGSNPSLAVHSGKYCIYSGDVNQDGFVTGDDFEGVDNDAANFDFHVATDVNGDSFVTGDDFQFIDNNAALFVQRQVPPGAPSHLVKRDVKSNVQHKSSVN